MGHEDEHLDSSCVFGRCYSDSFWEGKKRRIVTGLILWFLGYCMPTLGFMVMDLFPMNLLLIFMVWGVFEIPLATLVGAWLYNEPRRPPRHQ